MDSTDSEVAVQNENACLSVEESTDEQDAPEKESNAAENDEQQELVEEQPDVQQELVEEQPDVQQELVGEQPPKKRGRGRPPKVKSVSQSSNSDASKAHESETLSPQPASTLTGRPRRQITPKVDSNYVYANNTGLSASSPSKEDQQKQPKAGMKRKVKTEPEETVYDFHEVPILENEETREAQEVDDVNQKDLVQVVKIVSDNNDGVETEVVENELIEVEQTRDVEGPNVEVDDGTSTVSAGKEEYNESVAEKDLEFPDGYLPTDDKRLPKTVYMKDPSDPARKFKCPYVGCSYVAKYRSNLWDHKKTHTGEKPYHCTWPDCSMRFSQTHQLKLHTRSHTGERPYKCTWPGCDAAFSQKPGLRSHALTHTGEKNFVCDFPGCNWAFRLKGALTDHKRAIHEDKKTHMCEWPGCGKRFLQSCHLKKHLMAHADIKPYACDWPKCTYKAVTMAYVTNHRRTHTGERNHECNFKGCHKKFVKSSHVNRHRQRCHPEMFFQNGEGEYVEEEDQYNEEEGEYTIQQAIPNDAAESHDNENLTDNDQIVIEYSEQENEIIIQSGNSQTIYKGQLVEDKDGGQYIISDGQMIPLHDILTEGALKDSAVQEEAVYVKEEGVEDPEAQAV